MGTIIKVKRKITEDPVECLILECKKKKLSLDGEASESKPAEIDAAAAAAAAVLATETAVLSAVESKNTLPSIKQVLKYVGSAQNETEVSAKLAELLSIRRLAKGAATARPRVSAKSASASRQQQRDARLKQEVRDEAKSQRYVLFGKRRHLESLTSKSANGMNVIDVVSSEYSTQEEQAAITCNGVELIREKVTPTATAKPEQFVYDIYYTTNPDIHLDLLYPNNYEIKSSSKLNELCMLDENCDDESDEVYSDDEDSNEESNWRNDYPDEEDDYDIDEDDDEYCAKRRGNASDDYDDNYDEYGGGYDEGEDGEQTTRLASYMKKCNIDRSYNLDENSEDDYDEYDGEMPKSYSEYKKRLLRELEQDH